MKIESYLPVFPGFYGSIFEPDEEQEIYNLSEDAGRDLDYDDIEWDYEDHSERVSEACADAIETYLKSEGFDITVTYQKLVSPKFYNYTNDSINVEYDLSEEVFNKLIEYCKEHLEEFEGYLEETYSSRPGFTSFYNTDADTWFDEYLSLDSDKITHGFGSLLEFIIGNEGYTYEDLYYDIAEETYVYGTIKETED